MLDDQLYDGRVRQLAAGAGAMTRADRAHCKARLGSARGRAWHNTLIAAVNAGLAQGVFGLRPGENFWPEAAGQCWPKISGHVFDFTVRGIPGLAYVSDCGWDELYINVTLWPTDQARRWIFCGSITNRLSAPTVGDTVASGWVERRLGRWLMPTPSLFYCRRDRKAAVTELNIEPLGFEPCGRFII